VWVFVCVFFLIFFVWTQELNIIILLLIFQNIIYLYYKYI
jgi:hypothetical protein